MRTSNLCAGSNGITVTNLKENSRGKGKRFPFTVLLIAVLCLVGVRGEAQIVWANTGASTAWYTAANWSPSTAFGAWTTSSLGQFQNAGTATTAGINFGTSQLSIGAIEVTSARTRALTIGSSAATVGAFTLNGTTVNSVPNVILRNGSGSLLTLQNNETGTGKTMNIVLANTTDNLIYVDGSGGVTISSNLSGTSKKLSLSGAGTGALILAGTNTYTGGTNINAGTFVFGATNTLPSSGNVTLNGGTLKTGATTGFSQSTAAGALVLTDNSTIALGTGSHTLKFAASNATSWTNAKTLTITGWTTTLGVGTSGTAGQVFVGITSAGLTAAQLAQIRFSISGVNYPATILSTGEIVPANQIVATVSPTSPTAGTGFSVTINTKDKDGNAANVTNATTVTLTTNGNAGALSGTTTGIISAGGNSVTISGVLLASAGTGVTITASSSSGDLLVAGTTSSFTVTAPATPTVSTDAVSSLATTGASLNGTVNAQGAVTTVQFEYGFNGSYGTTVAATQSPLSSNTNTGVSKGISSLSINTQYHYRVDATNAGGTTNGSDVAFYTLANVPGTPTVNNPTTSTLDVTLNVNSNPSNTVFSIQETGGLFVQANGTLGATEVFQTASAWGAANLVTINGLSTGTTYAFHVRAKNGDNVVTSYSSSASNTTSAGCTTPSQQPISFGTNNIADVTANINFTRGNGNQVIVLAHSGSAVDATPVAGTSYTANASFGSGSQVGTGNYVVYSGSASGANTATGDIAISGLSTGTSYYFAAYEFNNTSVCYNSVSPLTGNLTTLTLPSVSTVSISNITEQSAQSGGNTINAGGGSITHEGMVWGTSANPILAGGNLTDDGTSASSFSSSITALSAQQYYYVRAYVTNLAGTGYGSIVNFYTLSNPVTTQASGLSATPVSNSQINLAWTTASFPGSGASANGYIILSRADGALPTTAGVANGVAPGLLSLASGTSLATIITSGATATFSHTGLTGNTNYGYDIIPFTWDGTNAATYNYLTTSAPTANALTITDAPFATAATNRTINSFTANWSATAGATTYRVDVSSDNFVTFLAGYNDLSIAPATSINLPGLTSGTSYQYRLRAANGSGVSANSNVVNAITFAVAPSLQSSITFGTVTQNSIVVNFSGGNGAKHLLLVRLGSAVATDPTSGTTYTANSVYGSGSAIGAAYVVYAGAGNTVTVTGLSSITTYYFAVYDYNDASLAGAENYLTPGGANNTATSAATYTWTGGSASFATAANWSPSRSTPAASDILQFTDGTTETVTGVTTQTIAQLVVSGGTKVTLQAGAATQTLTIAGGAGTDLSVAGSTSELDISGSNGLTISVSTGATASIQGQMTFAGGAHVLKAVDASSINFASASSFTTSTLFTGNAFGTTALNSVVFASGSSYYHNAGSNPFGASTPNSVVVFNNGSNFYFRPGGVSTPSVIGRTYANLILQNSTTVSTTATTGTLQMQSLTVESGSSFTFGGSSSSGVVITGDISSEGAANISITSGSGGIQLNGGTTQTIGAGAGTGSISLDKVTGSSSTTIVLNRNYANSGSTTINGTLKMGTFQITGAGTFTLGSNASIITANASGLAGAIASTGAKSLSSSANYEFDGTSTGSFTTSPTANTVGTLTANNAGGTVTMAQNIIVTGAATLSAGTLSIGSNTLTLNGALNVTSGSLSSLSNGTVNFNQSTDGQVVPALSYGNLTFSNHNKVLPSSGTVSISGVFTPGTATAHTVTGSDIAFNGGSQTVPAFTYYNVDVLGNGNSSLSGNIVVLNNFSNGSSSTFSAGSNSITVTGNWQNQGTFTPGTGTVNFSGAAESITGVTNFNNVTVAANDVLTVNDNISAGGNLTVNGTLNPGFDVVVVSGTGTLTGTGTVKVIRAVGSSDFGGQYSISNKTLTNLTVEYASATAQGADGLSYGTLTINNSGGVTLSGTAAVGGNINMSSGLLKLSSYDLTLTGDFSGSNASRYVVTDGAGSLILKTINVTARTFAVGSDATNWTPIQIANGDGLDYKVRIQTGIYPANTTFNGSKAIQRTWNVTAIGGTPSGATLTFGYSEDALKGSGWDNAQTDVAVNHYNTGNSAWETVGTATPSGSSSFRTVSVSGVSSFSPFAISQVNAPLPVTLLSFSGKHDGGVNKLQWKTATEMNNRGFEVQRSTDGRNFSSIGFVASKAENGNSTSDLSYGFTDGVASGKVYYRLKQTDLDGRKKLSNVIAIDGDTKLQVRVYGIAPNPAQATVSLQLQSPTAQKLLIVVTNVAGQQVKQVALAVEAGNNTTTLDVSTLSAGTYFVKTIAADGTQSEGVKVVKQ